MDPMKLVQSRMEQISKVCSPRDARATIKRHMIITMDVTFVPQIACFQRTQMEGVIAHEKAKSAELARQLHGVTDKAYR